MANDKIPEFRFTGDIASLASARLAAAEIWRVKSAKDDIDAKVSGMIGATANPLRDLLRGVDVDPQAVHAAVDKIFALRLSAPPEGIEFLTRYHAARAKLAAWLGAAGLASLDAGETTAYMRQYFGGNVLFVAKKRKAPRKFKKGAK
mgnify:CR=1 FL=1